MYMYVCYDLILYVRVMFQVDKASLKEVCGEYGRVLTCLIDPSSESALVHYGSEDEAMQAKAGLDKNPTICGVTVVSDFASSADLSVLYSQHGNSALRKSEALDETTPSWFTDTDSAPPSSAPFPPATSSSSSSSSASSIRGGKWNEPLPCSLSSAPPSYDQVLPTSTSRSSGSTTPSTPWGGGEFLPGLSSLWRSNLAGPGQLETGEEPSPTLGSPFLHNGMM